MRQIILDTETTGFSESKNKAHGHRIIELGCVELIDRHPTNNYFHCYFNPQRSVDTKAYSIHGLNDEFLAQQPLFIDKLVEIENYLAGADELIAHNMSFDCQFLNQELSLAQRSYTLNEQFYLVDTLQIARKRFPGSKNSLDALCQRFGIDNSNRELHGALLDAQLLTEVYLKLTGGQSDLSLAIQNSMVIPQTASQKQWKKIEVSQTEKIAHQSILESIKS